MQVTNEEVGQAIQTLKAVADAIKELGSVPSGELYARLMGHMSIQTYDKIIGILANGQIIRKESNLLIWNVQ